jgi:predicted aspartyl protease
VISEGKAHYTGESKNIILADGSHHSEQEISLDTLTIGKHTRHNVAATVSTGEMLLGLPVLKAIGKFTIDGQNNKLIFG